MESKQTQLFSQLKVIHKSQEQPSQCFFSFGKFSHLDQKQKLMMQRPLFEIHGPKWPHNEELFLKFRQ